MRVGPVREVSAEYQEAVRKLDHGFHGFSGWGLSRESCKAGSSPFRQGFLGVATGRMADLLSWACGLLLLL